MSTYKDLTMQESSKTPTIQDFLTSSPPSATPTASQEYSAPKKLRRRFPWLKIALAGVLGLLLVVGTGTIVYLTQQEQDSRSRASAGQYPEMVVATTSRGPGHFDFIFDGSTMPIGTTISSVDIKLAVYPERMSTPTPPLQGQGEAYPAGSVQGVSTESQELIAQNGDFPTVWGEVTPVSSPSIYPRPPETPSPSIYPKPTSTSYPKYSPTPYPTPTPVNQICYPEKPTCPSGYTCVPNTTPGVKVCDEQGNCIYGDPAPGYCLPTAAKTPIPTPYPPTNPPSPTPPAQETLIYDNRKGVQVYIRNQYLSTLQLASSDVQETPDGSVTFIASVKVAGSALSDPKFFQGKQILGRIEYRPTYGGEYGGGSGVPTAKILSQSIRGYRPGSAVVEELYEPNLPKPTPPGKTPTPDTIIPCGENGSCPAGYSCITPVPPPTNCVPKPGVVCPQPVPAMPRCVKNPEPTAKPAYDLKKCWSSVIVKGTSVLTRYYWPNGCRGIVSSGQICKKGQVSLTKTEIAQYKAWIKAGKPALEACGIILNTPKPSPVINTPKPSPVLKTPWPSPSLKPTGTPTPRPSPIVKSPWPSSTPYASFKPSPYPTAQPTVYPTTQPTIRPTVRPTPVLTPKPTPIPVWRRIIPWLGR